MILRVFRPETDFDAYVKSAKRLAQLAPELRLVLGAHNIPVAEPAILVELVAAIQTVRAGKVTPEKTEGGKSLYKVGAITFLLKAGPAGVNRIVPKCCTGPILEKNYFLCLRNSAAIPSDLRRRAKTARFEEKNKRPSEKTFRVLTAGRQEILGPFWSSMTRVLSPSSALSPLTTGLFGPVADCRLRNPFIRRA